MRTVRDATELRRAIREWRWCDLEIAFVPTMGALHEGHLSLVRRAREIADEVVVSIFVNPSQFGPSEDLASYPRDPEGDAARLAAEGCSLLFLPETETLYPPGHSTWIEAAGPSAGLEGEHRPGHFRGVATAVCQLLNLVQPDRAVFGEKDAQQLAVISRLVRDLHLPVEIVRAPTVREADGLAMSSRNAHLSPTQRRAAGVLHRSLERARRAIAAGERRSREICRLVHEELAAEPLAAADYVAVVDGETFEPVQTLAGHVTLPIAVRVGGVRLIDNLQLELPAAVAPRAEKAVA